jgi:hypothetical protein
MRYVGRFLALADYGRGTRTALKIELNGGSGAEV